MNVFFYVLSKYFTSTHVHCPVQCLSAELGTGGHIYSVPLKPPYQLRKGLVLVMMCCVIHMCHHNNMPPIHVHKVYVEKRQSYILPQTVAQKDPLKHVDFYEGSFWQQQSVVIRCATETRRTAHY